MNLSALLQEIRAFRDERDWSQFHNAKDMAAAIAIEASELQELFLWKTGEEIGEATRKKRAQIEEEVADIAVYLFELSDSLGIDLERAIIAKLAKNAIKYPADKARGTSKKYTDL